MSIKDIHARGWWVIIQAYFLWLVFAAICLNYWGAFGDFLVIGVFCLFLAYGGFIVWIIFMVITVVPLGILAHLVPEFAFMAPS